MTDLISSLSWISGIALPGKEVLEAMDRFKFRSPMADVMEQQFAILDKLKAIDTISNEFHNSFNRNLLKLPNLDYLDDLMATVKFSSIHNISESISDSIGRINIQQREFAAIIDNLKWVDRIGFPKHSYLTGLSDVFSKITTNITAKAIIQEDWEMIEDLDRIGATVLSEIEHQQGQALNLDIDGQERIYEQLLELWHKYKKTGGKIINFLGIIGILMSFHQYADFLKPKEEVATKSDVSALRAQINKQPNNENILSRVYRVLNTKCVVFLKPTQHSYAIDSLPEAFKVIPLEVNHKWVYISFESPKDGITVSGWILKKYLDKP